MWNLQVTNLDRGANHSKKSMSWNLKKSTRKSKSQRKRREKVKKSAKSKKSQKVRKIFIKEKSQCHVFFEWFSPRFRSSGDSNLQCLKAKQRWSLLTPSFIMGEGVDYDILKNIPAVSYHCTSCLRFWYLKINLLYLFCRNPPKFFNFQILVLFLPVCWYPSQSSLFTPIAINPSPYN